MGPYCIKTGYKPNLDEMSPCLHYNEKVGSSEIHQVAVYKYVAQLIRSAALRNCLDIGCGYGYKLVKHIYPVCHDITGIDIDHAITFCREHYNCGRWLVDDIELPRFPAKSKYDLIISADVIEHLVKPNNLLDYIKNHASEETYVVISTPERDLVRGVNSFGPPDNPVHVREWNAGEFRSYLESQGFILQSQFLVQQKQISFKEAVRNLKAISLPKIKKICQVCLCTMK